MKKIFFLSFFVLGFFSLVAQVVVIRELAISFYGNEFFVGWVLFAWLFWTSAGSFLQRRFFRSPGRTFTDLWICHAVAAVVFFSSLLLIRSGKLVLGVPAGAVPDLIPSLVFSFVALAPLCLLLGFQFAFAVRCWLLGNLGEAPPRVTSRAYLMEVLGFIAGGILFSYFFVFMNEFHIAGILAGANLLVACVLFYFSYPQRRLFRRIFIAGGVFLLMGLFMKGGSLQQQTMQWLFPNEKLMDFENTVHGNLAVTQIGQQYNFYQNGILLGAGEEKLASEYLVHFPMLFHRAPKKILLLGTGFNGALREILKYGPEQVVDVELDPRQIEVAKKYISPNLRQTLEDKRVRIWTGDSRSFLRDSRELFDVVILNAPNPSTVLLNRQYTAEFFKKIQACLVPGGIVALRLTFAANYVPPELEALAASVYKTLKRSFPNVRVLPEDTLYMMASMAPLVEDPAVLVLRLETRGLKNDFVTPAYLQYRMTNDRVRQVAALLEKNKRAWLNKDLRPRGYYYDFLYWISSFNPRISKMLSWPLYMPFPFLFGLVILVIFLGSMFLRGRFLSAAAMSTGGFSLMTAEILLIYIFQIFYGNVYYKIAWIITAFMIGMGGGTWFSNRKSSNEPRSVLGLLHVAVAGYFLLLTFLGWLLTRGFFSIAGWGEVFFLVGASGIGGLIGIEFPLANHFFLAESATQKRSTGMIYAADLFGSCLGALLTAAFLIPVWGVYRILLLLAGMNVAMALLLLFRKNLGGKNL